MISSFLVPRLYGNDVFEYLFPAFAKEYSCKILAVFYESISSTKVKKSNLKTSNQVFYGRWTYLEFEESFDGSKRHKTPSKDHNNQMEFNQ